MAHLTSEQSDVIRALKDQYGSPNRESIENTSEPYGLVWLQWISDARTLIIGSQRNLFIRPDGTRLSWRSIV